MTFITPKCVYDDREMDRYDVGGPRHASIFVSRDRRCVFVQDKQLPRRVHLANQAEIYGLWEAYGIPALLAVLHRTAHQEDLELVEAGRSHGLNEHPPAD